VATQPDGKAPAAAGQLSSIQHTLGKAFAQFEPLTEREDLREAVEAIAAGNERLTPLEQAEIYREQFWLRHRDVLYEDYPGLSYLLGEDAFERFARAYLEACPPDSWTLRDLGNRIVAFAEGYDDFDSDKRALLLDMVRYELAFVDVFDGPEVAPLDPATVAKLPPEAWAKAVVKLHPQLVLLRLGHPVQELRSIVRMLDDDADEADKPDRDIAPDDVRLVLFRGDELKVRYATFEPLPFELLELLGRGVPLVEACDAAASGLSADEQQGFADKLQGWFRYWGKRGFIFDIVVDGVGLRERNGGEG
jgi:hypothetical protein